MKNPLRDIDFFEGCFLLIDKPSEWTSFDVVNKIRWRLRLKYDVKKIKVGHAGTLDPMATGLLVVATGKFTKKIDSIQGLPKVYEGQMTLGATTPTYDAESEVDAVYPVDHIDHSALDSSRQSFLGPGMQVPPIYSAIKKNGSRLYELARRGKTIELEPRPIHIYRFELTHVAMPLIDFRVHCSKGTYIRSLAYDLGQKLKSGAYLSRLRRTAIGDLKIEDAMTIESFEQYLNELPSD